MHAQAHPQQASLISPLSLTRSPLCPSFLRSVKAAVKADRLGALATDAAGELDVLGHDGGGSVDRAEVGVLEEANEVRLRRSWRATTADDWKRRSVLKSWRSRARGAGTAACG